MNSFARLLGFLLRPIPRPFLRALGIPLGFLWYDVIRFRRKVVQENLKRAFPEWTEEKRQELGRRTVYGLMKNFFEFFLILAVDEDWMQKNIIFEGLEHLDRAKADGKGALLLSLHLGQGDLMANCLARRGYKVSIITKFFNSRLLNALWFGVRGAQGVEHIPPHGERTPFMILKFLKANGMVGFVLDQHMGKPFGVRTEFFGSPAGTAYGLALFHLKTKRPVVPIYNYLGSDGKIHIVADSPLVYKPEHENLDREQTLVELTQCYTTKIEEIVRKYPEQWMWIHRRWKWKGP